MRDDDRLLGSFQFLVQREHSVQLTAIPGAYGGGASVHVGHRLLGKVGAHAEVFALSADEHDPQIRPGDELLQALREAAEDRLVQRVVFGRLIQGELQDRADLLAEQSRFRHTVRQAPMAANSVAETLLISIASEMIICFVPLRLVSSATAASGSSVSIS